MATNNTNQADPQGGSAVDETKAPVATTEVTPEWVANLLTSNNTVFESNVAVVASNKALIESNGLLLAAFEKVIASNESAVEGIASFKETASEFVEELVNKFAPANGATVSNLEKVKPVLEIDHDANYVLVPGAKIQDKDDATVQYAGGDDVTHLGAERLNNLLNQGLIQES
jgi:hypothetical protein